MRISDSNSLFISDLGQGFSHDPLRVTTMALGEEGGQATTMALGEEGGEVTTMAIGEEGGDLTTTAIGEESGFGETGHAAGFQGPPPTSQATSTPSDKSSGGKGAHRHV